MQRRGGNPNNAYCPRFPRGKNEGWFVTLGTIEYGELHALKRVPARGNAQITFYAPSQTGNKNLELTNFSKVGVLMSKKLNSQITA